MKIAGYPIKLHKDVPAYHTVKPVVNVQVESLDEPERHKIGMPCVIVRERHPLPEMVPGDHPYPGT